MALNQTLTAAWRGWPLAVRAGGLAVTLGFFLPWCGQLNGARLARAEGYEFLWLFLAGGMLLLATGLIPRIRFRPWVELVTSTALLAGIIYVGYRLGRNARIGVYLTGIGSLAGLVGALLQLRRLLRAPAPPPDGKVDHAAE